MLLGRSCMLMSTHVEMIKLSGATFELTKLFLGLSILEPLSKLLGVDTCAAGCEVLL